MAINSNTGSRLWLDVGTVTVDGTDIGGTEQQGSFSVEQEIYKPRLGGSRGFLAGVAKVITEHAMLTVNLAELTVDNFTKILPTVTSDSDANSEYTVQEDLGAIGSAEFVTVIFDGETLGGKEILLKLYNALPDGGLSGNVDDTAESQVAVTWRSHYDQANPKQRTWQLFIEK